MSIELRDPPTLRAPFALTLGVCLSLALVAPACGDDTSVGTSDSTAGTGDSGDTANTETGGDDNTTTGDGDGDPGDGDPTGDGDGDPLPTEITVGGEVTDFFTMMGIEGATVSVKDMPNFQTVSGAEGIYELLGMPPSTEVFFLIDGNDPEYWGGIRPAMLPAQDIDDLELGQISDELIQLQLSLLAQQDPTVMADETKAVVIVRILQTSAIDEMTQATVDFMPPPPPGTSYGVNFNSNPVLDSTQIGSPLLPFWVAFNLDPDEIGGAYAVEVTHPERVCTVLHSVFPTRTRYVTLVEVDCPPMP